MISIQWRVFGLQRSFLSSMKIFADKRLNFECNKQCESLSWHVDTFNATATGYWIYWYQWIIRSCCVQYLFSIMKCTLLLLIMLRQWICAKIIFQIASSNIMYSWGYLSLCLIDRRGHECNVYHCVNKISVFGNFNINVLVNVQCFHKKNRLLIVQGARVNGESMTPPRSKGETVGDL